MSFLRCGKSFDSSEISVLSNTFLSESTVVTKET